VRTSIGRTSEADPGDQASRRGLQAQLAAAARVEGDALSCGRPQTENVLWIIICIVGLQSLQQTSGIDRRHISCSTYSPLWCSREGRHVVVEQCHATIAVGGVGVVKDMLHPSRQS